MAELGVVAQNLMDLWYQEDPSGEQFFEIYHFKYMVAIAYAQLLQEEYNQSYQRNLSEEGMGVPSLSSDWYISEEIRVVASDDIAPFKAELKTRPFSFAYDRQNSGIKDIIPISGKCRDFIRIGLEARWQLHHIPDEDVVYWFPIQKDVFFEKLFCGTKAIRILYIPSLDGLEDKSQIPDVYQGQIIAGALQLMRMAKDGVVIDTTNDNNANATLQTEINNLFKKFTR
jgi:hypothetical protein